MAVPGIEGGYTFIKYEPANEAAREKIEAGELGTFQGVTIEENLVSVTTNLGVFRFKGPQLETPDASIAPSSYYDAGETLASTSMEENLVDIFALMKLFHEVARGQRQMAREARHAEREGMIAKIHAQADKIREAAAYAMAAGIVTGAFQIVSGGMTAYGGIKGLKIMKGGGEGAQVQAQNIGYKWQGIGQATSGVGQIISSGLEFGAGQAREAEKRLQADEKVHETHVQDETEWMQNMLDLMREVRQKMEEVIRAQQDTLKSIIRA